MRIVKSIWPFSWYGELLDYAIAVQLPSFETPKERQVEPQISSERISDTKASFLLCFTTLQSCRCGRSAVLSS